MSSDPLEAVPRHGRIHERDHELLRVHMPEILKGLLLKTPKVDEAYVPEEIFSRNLLLPGPFLIR